MAGWIDSLGISASGLTAQRLRMDVIASNIANAQTTRTPEGGPYRRRVVELEPVNAPTFAEVLTGVSSGAGETGVGAGVRVAGVVTDPSPFPVVYDPSNPDAVNGYVQMPNVDISTEMVDMVAAARAYEANVTAFNAGKQMQMDALSIGK
ncbi:flagellar basal body rod protein FlgC [Alicyclobacillus macrosporangiidus]|jgi:flagellar basal-body rod protein FlgC|uniref:Flagellar basal-body rod protein FlgC n=1 Tax=Alicyclobacillus macrosporangiidus TaxID=392015 RepID=A0A1I7IQ86_9BACL|nr:flagellar basal body rod protein FlgC [Alicyclobacillus macrosporangiidus]SFU75064.1 flagellar basal-body rod protein FlgC [Alicyclobacillus macrosporangiidus]